MTEKRFKHKYNMLGMQFICYDDKDILLGTFADSEGVEHIVDKLNQLNDENEQLKQQLSDIDGQLVMLDNCDNWDYDRMKHTVREIAEIIGYNGTINPKR